MADANAADVALQVNAKGEALVLYRRADGTPRRVLVWGAVNARPPTKGVPQVRFRYDYSGGWGKYRTLYWRTFRDACGRYDGAPLAYLVKACKAPDGSYWAVQLWQRGLPNLGYAPWKPFQSATELHISHWTGPLPVLEVYPNWTYASSARAIFGRFTYQGKPVHGFKSTSTGAPLDSYGRNVYIDVLNSAYGPGWMRENGILTHRSTGTFCYSFVSRNGYPGYPNRQKRPKGHGDRTRVTVMGPGVTPVVLTEIAGLSEADREHDAEFDATYERVMAGDRLCAGVR